MESVYSIGDKVIVFGKLSRHSDDLTKIRTWITTEVEPYTAIYVGWSIKVNGRYHQESVSGGHYSLESEYNPPYLEPISTIRVARVKKSSRGNDILIPFSHIKHFSDEIDILK